MYVDDMSLQEAESWVPFYVNKIGDINVGFLETSSAIEDLGDLVGHIANLGGQPDDEAVVILRTWSL